MIDWGMYCYKVVLLGLKKKGTTHQRLVVLWKYNLQITAHKNMQLQTKTNQQMKLHLDYRS